MTVGALALLSQPAITLITVWSILVGTMTWVGIRRLGVKSIYEVTSGTADIGLGLWLQMHYVNDRANISIDAGDSVSGSQGSR